MILFSPVAKKKDKISIKSLQHHHLSSVAGSNKARLNTLALHDILPKDKTLLRSAPQLPPDDKNKVLYAFNSTWNSTKFSGISDVAS